jgi:hypothetical protein
MMFFLLLKTKEGRPRYLLVTVDANTVDAVTFDSYSKQTGYHDDTMSINTFTDPLYIVKIFIADQSIQKIYDLGRLRFCLGRPKYGG